MVLLIVTPKVAQKVLFRDNLIIRLVLVYRSKENLRFKLSNSFLFPAVKSIQAHLPCVFDKTRVSDYIPLRRKQKYQVTNVFLKSNEIVTFAI